MITDISLIRFYDILSKQFVSIATKETLFVIVSIGCLAAEYVALRIIKPARNNEKSKSKLNLLLIYKLTESTLYFIGAMVVFVIFQILFLSHYNAFILLAIIVCSDALGIGILSVFIGRILVLVLIRRKSIILFLFVLALGSITVNAAITMFDVALRITDRPLEIRALFAGSVDLSKGKYDLLDNLYFITYILSFVTAWVATAALLSTYSRILGKIRYVLITVSPMVFFIGQFTAFFINEIYSITKIDQFFIASMTTLITVLSKPLGGLMLAIGFWSMAKVGANKSPLKRYLIISGFGFFLLFTSNQAILLSITPYPPFGVATITVMGISAYLVMIGIYMSTISLSHDAELRQLIRRIAKSQSMLFDSIVSEEIEKEIEMRVMEIIRKQSLQMEDETGASHH